MLVKRAFITLLSAIILTLEVLVHKIEQVSLSRMHTKSLSLPLFDSTNKKFKQFKQVATNKHYINITYDISLEFPLLYYVFLSFLASNDLTLVRLTLDTVASTLTTTRWFTIFAHLLSDGVGIGKSLICVYITRISHQRMRRILVEAVSSDCRTRFVSNRILIAPTSRYVWEG